MRGKKKILAALPHLTARELWFIKCDLHRAADAAAIGGASNAQWQEYVTLEEDVAEELKTRFPDSGCPFPRACIDGWSDEELKEMEELYKRIFRGKVVSCKKGKKK